MATPEKYDPVEFGADNTGTVDSTPFWEAAIKAMPAYGSGQSTKGTYRVKDWQILNNRLGDYDFANSQLNADPKAAFVIEVLTTPDNNRPGPPVLMSLTIHGQNVPNVIGLQSLTYAVRQTFEKLTIRNCDTGMLLVGPLNDHISDSTIHRNKNGLIIREHPTTSCANVTLLENVEFYLHKQCGLILDGTPGIGHMRGAVLINCTIQANDHCGIAAFSCDEIIVTGTYFENNGLAGVNDTITVGGLTIKRREIVLDDSKMSTDTQSPKVYMSNNSVIQYARGLNQRPLSGISVETDGSKCVIHCTGKFVGHDSYQALIHKIPYDNDVCIKCATIQPYRPVAGAFGMTNIESHAGTMMRRQTSHKDMDGYTLNITDTTLINGYRHDLDFGAIAGNRNVNFFVFNTDDIHPVADSDEVLYQFPVRASALGEFHFNFITGTFMDARMWVGTEWQMLTIQFRPAKGQPKTGLYVYPRSNDGLVLSIGGAMIQKIAKGADRTHIQRIVSEQIWLEQQGRPWNVLLEIG